MIHFKPLTFVAACILAGCSAEQPNKESSSAGAGEGALTGGKAPGAVAATHYNFEAVCNGGPRTHNVGFFDTIGEAEAACQSHLSQSGHKGPCEAVGDPNDEPETRPLSGLFGGLQDEIANSIANVPATLNVDPPVNYCTNQENGWTMGCSVSCTAGWEGNTCPNSCVATAPPGYIIDRYRVKLTSVNNGNHSASMLPANSKFDYEQHVSQAYDEAIDAAAKSGDKELEVKLKDEGKSMRDWSVSNSSTHQNVRLNVDATKHGSIINKKRGWSEGFVEVRLKCVLPSDLRTRVFKRYGLE